MSKKVVCTAWSALRVAVLAPAVLVPAVLVPAVLVPAVLLPALLLLGVAPGLRAQSAPAGPGQAAGDSVQIVPFRAFSADAATLLYTGEYRAERQGSQLKEVQAYRSPQGTPVHRVETVFDLESFKPVFYDSHNLRTGARARIRWEPDGLHYEVWKSKEEPSSTGTESDAALLVWPNLVHIVARNWQDLASGKTMELPLYVASMRMSVTVKVAAEALEAGGNPAEVGRFLVEPSAWLVRAMASPVHLELSQQAPHHLLKYQGRGIISGADGKSVDLLILFDWPKAG